MISHKASEREKAWRPTAKCAACTLPACLLCVLVVCACVLNMCGHSPGAPPPTRHHSNFVRPSIVRWRGWPTAQWPHCEFGPASGARNPKGGRPWPAIAKKQRGERRSSRDKLKRIGPTARFVARQRTQPVRKAKGKRRKKQREATSPAADGPAHTLTLTRALADKLNSHEPLQLSHIQTCPPTQQQQQQQQHRDAPSCACRRQLAGSRSADLKVNRKPKEANSNEGTASIKFAKT